MDLGKWHDAAWPLRSARAIAPDCFHGWVGLGCKEPCLNGVEGHEVH